MSRKKSLTMQEDIETTTTVDTFIPDYINSSLTEPTDNPVVFSYYRPRVSRPYPIPSSEPPAAYYPYFASIWVKQAAAAIGAMFAGVGTIGGIGVVTVWSEGLASALSAIVITAMEMGLPAAIAQLLMLGGPYAIAASIPVLIALLTMFINEWNEKFANYYHEWYRLIINEGEKHINDKVYLDGNWHYVYKSYTVVFSMNFTAMSVTQRFNQYQTLGRGGKKAYIELTGAFPTLNFGNKSWMNVEVVEPPRIIWEYNPMS